MSHLLAAAAITFGRCRSLPSYKHILRPSPLLPPINILLPKGIIWRPANGAVPIVPGRFLPSPQGDFFGLELGLRIRNNAVSTKRNRTHRCRRDSEPDPPAYSPTSMPRPGELLDCDIWRVERRSDGALLVRVSSRRVPGIRLPDAVFSFHSGDPQYGYWEERFREQQGVAS